MTFTVVLTGKATKTLGKLPSSVRGRIVAVLTRCRIRPQAHAKKLVASPYFALRAGDYRIIIDIKAGKLIVLVIDIAHRKTVYKR